MLKKMTRSQLKRSPNEGMHSLKQYQYKCAPFERESFPAHDMRGMSRVRKDTGRVRIYVRTGSAIIPRAFLSSR